MYTLLSILIIAVCVFLTLIVLVQNSKGGGLAANFSSSNQIMGVRKTADFLEKATWTLAGALVVLCMLAAFILPTAGEGASSSDSILDSKIENAVDPASVPSFPTPAVPSAPPADTAE
jgi:preprotein translocase subunit SecG